MPKSKNHHYTPQCVLKGFCFSGASALLFDGQDPELGYRQKNISRIHQKFHLNTIQRIDGSEDDRPEGLFGKNVDSPLGETLLRLRECPEDQLPKTDRENIARYICGSLFRSPISKQYVDNLIDGDVWDFANAFFDLSLGVTKLTGGGPLLRGVTSFSDYFHEAIAEADYGDMMDRMVEGTLVVARPAVATEVLIVGDFPFMRYDDPRLAAEHVDVANEIWVPLDKDLAVSFLVSSFVKAPQLNVRLPKRFIRRLNFDFAQRSRFVVGSCPVQLHRAASWQIPYSERLEALQTDISEFKEGGIYREARSRAQAESG